MRVGAASVVVEPAAPPVRLRHVLSLSILALLVWSGLPRLRAAFRLHSAATAFADYALCMVGPTGPSLLRDNPAEFRTLVRRRLVASSPDERPFSRCAKGAREVTQSSDVERAHGGLSVSFVEYGLVTPGSPDALTLDRLAVTTRELAQLADEGWPFVRGGYTSLVQASAYAAEAPHPVELPRPGASRGVAPQRSLARCDSPKGSYLLGLSADRRSKIVRSLSPSGVASDATLSSADARVFAVSCDAAAVVVALGRPGARDVELVTCAHLGSCAKAPLPRLGSAGFPTYPLDVVRAAGVTVLAVPMHGIVRVASSRDDGATWTPFTVAFDPAAHPELRFDVQVPDRLLVTGKRVLLHGAASTPSATFPVLASDDYGASWHAP